MLSVNMIDSYPRSIRRRARTPHKSPLDARNRYRMDGYLSARARVAQPSSFGRWFMAQLLSKCVALRPVSVRRG